MGRTGKETLPSQDRLADEGPQVDRVRQVCRYIEEHLEEPLTLALLGQQAKLSPAHLQRVFRRVMGITPRQYADACRLGQLKERLRDERTATVTTALYEVGYGSSRGLYERAPAQLGMTPGAYRRGGKGLSLRFTLADCPLGRLLLAATERGVSAVYLGDRDTELEAALRKEYPAATVSRDDHTLRAWLEELLEHLRGQLPHLALPLDVQATAFQWRVWQELQAIPAGSTRTYGEIAAALGQPTAARAVARACATNPVSVIIPCHRVIREDGGLGGYRWGLHRKRALLEREEKDARPAAEDGEA
jgi:AraC family transcriptional regulator of adaptative response/methylated-DNA-[protein]-cysteine methyltransferase